jgi:hypothetical protein
MLALCGYLTQSRPKPATVSPLPFQYFHILTDWFCVACSAKRATNQKVGSSNLSGRTIFSIT